MPDLNGDLTVRQLPHPPTPDACASALPGLSSNRFVDILEEGVAEWARQQGAATQPLSMGSGLPGGLHSGQNSDCEEDHAGVGRVQGAGAAC